MKNILCIVFGQSSSAGVPHRLTEPSYLHPRQHIFFPFPEFLGSYVCRLVSNLVENSEYLFFETRLVAYQKSETRYHVYVFYGFVIRYIK